MSTHHPLAINYALRLTIQQGFPRGLAGPLETLLNGYFP